MLTKINSHDESAAKKSRVTVVTGGVSKTGGGAFRSLLLEGRYVEDIADRSGTVSEECTGGSGSQSRSKIRRSSTFGFLKPKRED